MCYCNLTLKVMYTLRLKYLHYPLKINPSRTLKEKTCPFKDFITYKKYQELRKTKKDFKT